MKTLNILKHDLAIIQAKGKPENSSLNHHCLHATLHVHAFMMARQRRKRYSNIDVKEMKDAIVSYDYQFNLIKQLVLIKRKMFSQ